ncbi:MAG: mechanosensitive ion channel family protein [Clostridiales Family XIII bacterium]|jgi:MscS family membrane protein|nr:mechanosensitive ion channel family protein [Clostridiales Family XIII bacterium]
MDTTGDVVQNNLLACVSGLIEAAIIVAVGFFLLKCIPYALEKQPRAERVREWIIGARKPLMALTVILAVGTWALTTMELWDGGGPRWLERFIAQAPDAGDKLLRIATIILVGLAVIFANKRSSFFTDSQRRDGVSLAMIRFASALLTLIVIAIVFVMIVTELGYNISALVAGLGLGGLTVALAAKDSASNLFGGAVIVAERPFEIGDWISIAGTPPVEGSVEDITMRSTIIRTASGAKTVVPNATLASSIITNWTGGMKRRRVEMELDLEYGSQAADIERFLADVRAMLESDEEVDKKDADVRFYDLAAYSLKVKLIYYSKKPKYADYLRVRERVNFRLVELAAQNHLSFAFPTYTIEQ